MKWDAYHACNIANSERDECLEGAPSSKRERQVRIEAAIRLDGVLKRNAVIPDALFGLRFNDEEESYFMLENRSRRNAGRAVQGSVPDALR